ncbi:MAG: hypothetical protein HOI47_26095 [Candidatus Scalindua sp.]|jgi:hypothetical protein|nr:hypothetical protein [Candidatus Scalindua sp.]MBT6230130.1 hypothetical protein [Candidatus Scalindua sp.]
MRIVNLATIRCVFVLVLTCSLSWAGNEEIIKERIQELDAMNKDVIEQVPDIPEDGEIRLKGDIIKNEGSIDISILQKEIDAIKTKNVTIKLGNYRQKTDKNEDGDIKVDDDLKDSALTNERAFNIDRNQQETSFPDEGKETGNEDKDESF